VLVLDTAIVIAIVIVGSAVARRILARSGIDGTLRTAVQMAAVTALSLPFAASIVRQIAMLARRLALEIIPGGDRVDLGRAARRSLVATFELAMGLVVAATTVAIVQPFVPGSFVLLLLVALGLVVLVRRSIGDFEGHVRAGSELLVEVLSGAPPDHSLAQLAAILPGFSASATVAIARGTPAVGHSLAELDLRARTGATVLAIARSPHGIATPSPGEPLQAGDVLALAGSDEAVAAARAVLTGHEPPAAP